MSSESSDRTERLKTFIALLYRAHSRDEAPHQEASPIIPMHFVQPDPQQPIYLRLEQPQDAISPQQEALLRALQTSSKPETSEGGV